MLAEDLLLPMPILCYLVRWGSKIFTFNVSLTQPVSDGL